MILLSIVLLGVGITLFFKPDIFWIMTESWKSDNAYGPSDLYKFSTKFGGVITFIVGLANLIIQVFLVY